MKNKTALTLVLCVAMLFSNAIMFVSAESLSPTSPPMLSIDFCNLQFEENVQILYAVSLKDIDPATISNKDFGMLFWTNPSTSYELGSEALALSTSGKTVIEASEYYVFEYKELAAKQMTDDIYARAFLRINGEIYYSNLKKYSVLQYAYNMLGKTAVGSSDQNLTALLSDLLDYGASAQTYFNYRTDRPANGEFYQINLTNGTLTSDGCTSGLYLKGTPVEITAPSTDVNGIPFAYWQNSVRGVVSRERTATITVGAVNETYTAIYEEASEEEPIELENYITQNLFAHYSGKINTANGNLDKNSTSWYDLSGNGNTITSVPLDNGFWTGYSYAIDKDAVILPETLAELVRQKEFSIELAIGSFDIASSVAKPNPAFLWSRNDKCTIYYNKYNQQLQFWRGKSAERLIHVCDLPYNMTITVTFKLNGEAILYVNGTEVTRAAATALLTSDTLILNDDSGTESRLALCEYYDIRFYDRELSATEVSSNYATDQLNYYNGSDPSQRLYSSTSATITPEILALGEATPVINTSPLPAYSYDNLDYAMTIGIERTNGGRLFSCWVGGGDSEEAFFVVAKSDTDGATWSDPILVIDPHSAELPLARSTIVGNLWLDPLGRLWLFFNQSLGQFDGKSSNWYIRCDNPDAETLVWTDPVYISYGMSLNKPIVLSDGTWLMNVSLWPRKAISAQFNNCYRELDDERGAWVYASSDQGKTWEARGMVVFPNTAFDEHMVVEQEDGTLTMYGRTYDGLYIAQSSDKGFTWSTPIESEIAHTSSRFCIRRLASGRLILIKHGKTIDTETATRYDLTVFLSDDDGKTWYGGLTIDSRNKVSYPDMTEGADGSIYIQYDYERAKYGHILYAKITEEDIAAGELVSEGSSLQNFVSIAFGLEINQALKP